MSVGVTLLSVAVYIMFFNFFMLGLHDIDGYRSLALHKTIGFANNAHDVPPLVGLI